MTNNNRRLNFPVKSAHKDTTPPAIINPAGPFDKIATARVSEAAMPNNQ